MKPSKGWRVLRGIVEGLSANMIGYPLRTLFPPQGRAVKFLPLQNIWDFRPPVSVDVSMNTTRPLRMVLPTTRRGLRLAGDAMNPGELEDKLEKYEQIRDLAAMRHYEGWQHDCTKMLDLL
jgi:hypothetical protein